MRRARLTSEPCVPRAAEQAGATNSHKAKQSEAKRSFSGASAGSARWNGAARGTWQWCAPVGSARAAVLGGADAKADAAE